MNIKKVTVGFVVQEFDTKKSRFTSQEFVAGDEVVWENALGARVEPPEDAYLNFDMVQPDAGVEKLVKASREALSALRQRPDSNGTICIFNRTIQGKPTKAAQNMVQSLCDQLESALRGLGTE